MKRLAVGLGSTGWHGCITPLIHDSYNAVVQVTLLNYSAAAYRGSGALQHDYSWNYSGLETVRRSVCRSPQINDPMFSAEPKTACLALRRLKTA